MATKNKKKQDLAEQIINGTYKPSTKSTFSGTRGSQSRTIKNNLDKEVKEEKTNYFDDGYQFGDVTKSVVQTGKKVGNFVDEEIVDPIKNFSKSYKLGKLNEELGFESYKKMMGEANNYDKVKKKYDDFVASNSDFINDSNLLDQSFQSLPNQIGALESGIKSGGIGAVIGAGVGGAIGSLGGAGGAAAGAVTGAKALGGTGYVTGSAEYSYKLESGLQYQALIEMGVPEEIALKEAKDTGLINAFIESGESILDLVTLGGVSALKGTLTKGLVKKYGQKTVASWVGENIVKNAVSEGVEEGLQETTSVLSEKRAMEKAGLERDDSQDKQRILQSAISGGFSGGLMGGATGLTSGITKVGVNTIAEKQNAINGGIQPTLTLENMQQNVPYTVKSNKGNAIAPLGNNSLNTPVLNKNNQPYNVLNNGKEYAPYVPINNTFRYEKSTNPKVNALNESMVKSNFDNSIESKSLSEVASTIIEDKGWNILFDNTITNKNGEPVNAFVTTENGEITIRVNPNSTRAAEFLIMHEVTHGIETSELLNLANDYASKNPEFAKVMESLKTKYSENDIDSEVLADICGELFGNQEFINSLVQDGSVQNKNIITKIYDAIKRLLNSLTEKGRQKNAYYDFVSELEQKWREAYKQTNTENAIKNIKTAKFSTEILPDGTRYTDLSSVFKTDLNNVSTKKFIQSLDGSSIETIDGDVIKFASKLKRKDLAGELVNSKTTFDKRIPKEDRASLKHNILMNIEEELQNSKHKKNNPDKDERHIEYDIVNFDIRDSLIYDGSNFYRVSFDIAITSDGKKYAYDVKGIRHNNSYKDLINQKKNQDGIVLSEESGDSELGSLLNNIPQSNNTVKSSTSVKHSIEKNNNKTWREHLEENYEATGTRTYMPDHITDDYDFAIDETTDSNEIRYSVEENGTEFEKNNLKQQQLDIILNNNPAEDDYHTWIRNVDDIKTFEESLQDNDWIGWETDGFDPDYDASMVKQALKTGKITVYSSYPIEQGIFVTPSKMEAESYSGNGKIYSKEVNLKDVAWIDPTQGQYAKTDISNTKFSIEETTNDQIQGLEDYTKPQIKNITTDYIKTALEYADVQADIVGMEIVGSRNRGTARLDSDLDIVVELTGEDLREDDLFNILNDDDEPLEINGIKVDINPILVERSGSLEEFMKRSNAYDKEQTKNSKSKYPDWINKIVPNEPYRKYRNYINDLMIQKQDETGLRITSDSSGVLVWQHGYASSLEKIKFEDTKKLAQQIYDLKATDNKGRTLSNEVIQKTKNSKARDEKGNLLSLYHGSPNIDITEFDINKSGQNTMSAEYGIYFTDSEKIADDFSYERIETDSMFFDKKGKKGKVYEAYLNLEKPLDFRKLSKQEISDLYEYASHLGQLDGKETFVEDMTKWQQIGNHQLMKVNLNLKKLSNKYDGFIAKMDVKNNELEYVVFDPKQVLFVDKNNESIKTNNIDNKGYHWGDLGKGRDTYHWNMSSSRRSTGHFGTGTYFLGSKDSNVGSLKENRPLHEVDFSKYNLFKPENENEAYTLHKGLKALNYINNFNSDDFESLQLMLEKHGITGQKSYEAFVKARELYFSDEYQNASYDSELDSISTYFMKELGFNGIDVRGIEGFDNGTYGSVIYDLDNTIKNTDTKYSMSEDNKGRTLSKEQQVYFKDSKVRDSEGRLLEVYHGTPNGGFTIFDRNKTGRESRKAQYGSGFYFTNDETLANAYTYEEDVYGGYLKGQNPTEYKVYLNITNPFVMTTKTENDHNLDRDKLKQLILNGDRDYFFDSWIPFTTKTINELNYKLDGLTEEEIKALSKEEKVDYWLKQEFDLKNFGDKNVLQEMHRAYKTNNDLLNNFQKIFGYDGIIFKNPNGTNQYVAFNSNQIKNVDNTNPTDNPDIRYSIEEDSSLINTPKQDNKGRKLTKKQQEFYKNEDKKLLDKNGNLKTLYHGTPYNNFTTFKGKLFCFSEDYKFAKEYGETKSFDQGLDADVEVKEVYVKAENIFDPSNPEHIKKLSDNLSDNINYWGNIWDKETLLNKLQRKDTLPPKWKPEQIENKKFGDYIGDDRHGYNNDMFVGVNDNNEIVYISQERELNKLSQTEKDMFQKQLLDGKEVIYTTYQTMFGDLTEKGIHNKINELQKQGEEYKKENGFENEAIDYYIKRLKENLEWIKKDIFPSNNHKLIPRVTTQESTELTDIDNWTYFETAMDNETRKDIVEIIQELGFDGVNMYEDGISNFAVFKPNQIKNVDNLNPSDSDDIRYSMVEDPLEISKLKKSDASTTPIAPFVKTEGGKEDGRSKHYSNLTKKSKFLNDKSVAAISNENGVKYYDKTTNQETLEKAKKELNNGGKSETLKWFNKDPKNADPTDIAKGWILLKQYQDKGDYDSVVQVAKKMRMMGTTTGKTLQMYAIMERLTPEGMVNYAQSELSEAYELMIKNKSKAWIDKHKSDFDLSPSEVKFIMDTMQEVSKMQDGYEKDVKLAEIQKLMTDKLPPEKGAGIKAWMRISMLFNPKTQVRNVLGNAVIAPVNAVGDAFASGIDKMIAKKTGVRTTGNVNLNSYNEGFKKGLYKSYNDFKKGINTRNIEGNRFEIGQGKSFNDKTLIGHKLNQIDNLLSFMLDAGDRGFYEATFNNSINNQLILNNTTKVTPEMIDIATTEALQRTWQDNNEYTKFVLNTRKGLNKLMSIGGYGLGDILIPFAKTPANLTKAIIDYSPVGLVHSLVEGHNLKNAIETGQFTAQQQHKFVQDLGKAVAGTMLYVIGYALAKAGAISGENDEDKDTANFMKNTLGISPYSIKIGNKTFTYDWAQPVAAPFAIMSDFMSSNDEDASILEKSISAINTGFNIVVEQSFMQSIKTVLDNKDGIATGIQEAIMELPSRAIPTLSKQIVDLTDGTQRQTFVYGKPLETAKNKVLAKIPGASKALAPTVDTMGREIKKYGGKNNIFNVFFNPASVNNENISESAGEIYRLYQETGRTDLMPRVSPYYINHKGEKIVLSNEDKSRFQKISGDIIEQNVKKIMSSSQYQYLSDEEKADIIQDIVNYSYNKARFDVLGIEMSDTYQSVSDYEDAGGNISDYYLFQSNIDNTNSETKKQSISNYLINSNLSDKEISYLYNKYYSSDEKMDLLSKFNIPIKEYIKFNLQSFESDYKNNGKAISGSKQAKVFNYINSLQLSATQKAILMKMQYKSYKKYDNQILKYINSLNATKFEKASYAKKLGFDYYDDYLINQILKKGDLSNEEKIKQLKALGFKYINGKIYK